MKKDLIVEDLFKLKQYGFIESNFIYYKNFTGEQIVVDKHNHIVRLSENEPEMLELVGKLIKDGVAKYDNN